MDGRTPEWNRSRPPAEKVRLCLPTWRLPWADGSAYAEDVTIGANRRNAGVGVSETDARAGLGPGGSRPCARSVGHP